MCGIIGVVRRRSTREPPDLAGLVDELQRAVTGITVVSEGEWRGDLAAVEEVATAVESVDTQLRGVPGVRALLGDPAGVMAVEHHVDRLESLVQAAEARLDAGEVDLDDLEPLNALLLRVRDAWWAI